MIGLIGIKKSASVEMREHFTVDTGKLKDYSEEVLKKFEETVVLSTCNRTEIYFNYTGNNTEEIKPYFFEVFKWDEKLYDQVFIVWQEEAYKHLFEVCAGFHSKITGEDQILGQVKNAYDEAKKYKMVSSKLHRFFQEAVSAGKKFKCRARLNDIPVSSASIAVNDAADKGCRTFLLIGYGSVGQLVLKYLLSQHTEKIFLAVRNMEKDYGISDERVEIINVNDKNRYINEVQAVISCTSSREIIVKKEDINETGENLHIYDLAMPRDVDSAAESLKRVELYNIDKISRINDKNKKLRIERMNENKYILDEGMKKFEEWEKLREVSGYIQHLKALGNKEAQKRIKNFNNKSRDEKDKKTAEVLIKSASDFYINRAIKVIKEETLKGNKEECLEIIRKIFRE